MFNQRNLQFPDTFDCQPGHYRGAVFREMGVILPAIRKGFIYTWLNPQEHSLRAIRSKPDNELLTFSMHVDERNFVPTGHFSDDIGIHAVFIEEFPVFIESSSDDRCTEDRVGFFLLRLGDEFHQVLSIIFRGSIAVDFLLFLIVVSKLDGDLVAGTNFLQDRLPEAFRQE